MRKLIKEIEYLFLMFNLVSEDDSRSEKVSSYVTFGSMFLFFVCFIFLGVSHFLFDGLLNEIITIALKAVFSLFILGVFLILLSSNKII